eukprot:3903666-Prymnesium_polylepis.2
MQRADADLADSAARTMGLHTVSLIAITLRAHHRLVVRVEHCEAERPGRLGSLRGSKQMYIDRCASLQVSLNAALATAREEGGEPFEFSVNKPPAALGTRRPNAWAPKERLGEGQWAVIERLPLGADATAPQRSHRLAPALPPQSQALPALHRAAPRLTDASSAAVMARRVDPFNERVVKQHRNAPAHPGS